MTKKGNLGLAHLLKAIEDDVQRALYAIIAGFEVLPDVETRVDRDALRRSGLTASRRIEYLHQKLTNLAKIATGDFEPQRADRSAESITREAVMFALAQDGRYGSIEAEPGVPDHDVVARVDGARMVQLLASLLIAASASAPNQTLKLTVSHAEERGAVTITWVISIPNPTAKFDWEAVTAGQDQDPGKSHGEIPLHSAYWHALAAALDADVSLTEVPHSITVTITAPLVRLLPAPLAAPKGDWTDAPILVLGKPGVSFTRIRGSCSVVSDPSELTTNSIIDDAKLLVINQRDDNHFDPSDSIAICQSANVPVLLRAERLTYDLLARYRDHVDAILIEPSGEARLAQYVRGLTQADRRLNDRMAEIH
jgi:hypothetical protein